MTHAAIIVMSHLQMFVFWLKFAAVAAPICIALRYYMAHTSNKRVLGFFDIESKDEGSTNHGRN